MICHLIVGKTPHQSGSHALCIDAVAALRKMCVCFGGGGGGGGVSSATQKTREYQNGSGYPHTDRYCTETIAPAVMRWLNNDHQTRWQQKGHQMQLCIAITSVTSGCIHTILRVGAHYARGVQHQMIIERSILLLLLRTRQLQCYAAARITIERHQQRGLLGFRW